MFTELNGRLFLKVDGLVINMANFMFARKASSRGGTALIFKHDKTQIIDMKLKEFWALLEQYEKENPDIDRNV